MRTIFIEICYYKLVDFNSFVLVVLTRCLSFFFFFFNRKFQKLVLIKTKLLTIEVIKILFGPTVPFTCCFGLNLHGTIVLCK